jgi:hypothetical protein
MVDPYWIKWRLKGSPEWIPLTRLLRTTGYPFDYRQTLRSRFGGGAAGEEWVGDAEITREGSSSYRDQLWTWRVTFALGPQRRNTCASLRQAQMQMTDYLKSRDVAFILMPREQWTRSG